MALKLLAKACVALIGRYVASPTQGATALIGRYPIARLALLTHLETGALRKKGCPYDYQSFLDNVHQISTCLPCDTLHKAYDHQF